SYNPHFLCGFAYNSFNLPQRHRVAENLKKVQEELIEFCLESFYHYLLNIQLIYLYMRLCAHL
ncbi:MAG: hypothetical protein N2738_01840, partial [Thermodesulfovibrionales bacterium]|nr:hypothetical protein [Thermodesulfovibrionales bacterium]